MTLHVSNISPSATEQDVRRLFGQYGEVISLKIANSTSKDCNSKTAIIQMLTTQALTAKKYLSTRRYRGRHIYVTPMESKVR